MKRKNRHQDPEVKPTNSRPVKTPGVTEEQSSTEETRECQANSPEAPTSPMVGPVVSSKFAEKYDQKFQFNSLGLDARLLQGIAKMGFTNPTLVQARAIPVALEGKDILARAKTGSGKTVAYLLPVLQAVLKKKEASSHSLPPGPSALILVPTRELAEQVYKATEKLSTFCSRAIKFINLAQNLSEQVQQLLLAENPDVVIATPSRAHMHINLTPQLIVNNLSYLVIDEADLVLSYGYENDLNSVAKALPKGLQTLLMSATLTSEVEALKKLFLRNPMLLKLEDDEDGDRDRLSQYVVRCGEDEKFLLLYVIFKLKLIKGKVIIFVGDIDRCYRVKLFLEQFGIKGCVLNSELPVNSRLHIVEEFNKSVYDIIIATDENEVLEDEEEKEAMETADSGAQAQIATGGDNDVQEQKEPRKKRRKQHIHKKDKEYGVSRGIDFQNVSCILNFDLPLSSRSYTHRIGRTARAGKSGMALSFVIPSHLFGKNKHTSNPACINDEKVLAKIQKSQMKKFKKLARPRESQQEEIEIIQPYHFPTESIAPFKYRFNDALRAVTRSAVREARTKELRLEILKSEKLKRHFEENPGDLDSLRHDTGLLRAARIQNHLKHVPDYLLAGVTGGKIRDENEVGFVGLKKQTQNRIRKARMTKRGSGNGSGKRGGKIKSNDPLRTFRGKRR